MSNERLAELRHYRLLWDDDWQLMAEAMEHEPIGMPLVEAIDEIDRLRADNERLLLENLELKMRPVFDEYRGYRA